MAYQKRTMKRAANGRPRAVYESLGDSRPSPSSACAQNCVSLQSGEDTFDTSIYQQCLNNSGCPESSNPTYGGGSSSSSSSSSGGGGIATAAGQIAGGLFGALFGPKPQAPAAKGPDTTTIVLAVGGAGLLLYLLTRNR